MIGSYREFDEIASSLKRVGHIGYVWVGAKMMGNDLKNDWYWTSGEPLSPNFKKWANGALPEPDYLEHKCALIKMNGNQRENNGPSLATWSCSSQAYSLCQV